MMYTKITFIFGIFLGCIAPNLCAQDADWKSLGPIAFPDNVSGQINGIGRITQIKFHPTNSEVLYATSASGGLYRSNNLGENWTVLGTDSMPHTQLASVCIDHTNDQILYVGTGDPNYYSSGFGIWKSTNGGISWDQYTTGLANRMAVELIMDPQDHLKLVAATNGGIFKTTDGGISWVEKLANKAFTDMKKHPENDSIYYAVTRSEFYRSADKGETWTEITNGIAVPGGGDGGGMRLAISAANEDVVYASMIKDEGTVFRSDDAGLSFSTVYHNPAQSLVGYNEDGGGQGNYNFGMCADPTDEDILYVVAHVVWKSTNGGVDWTKLTDWWLVVHTDMHGMEFSPYHTDMMFNVNDGGIWLSEDGGSNWQIKSDGLEATEAVHAATSPTQQDIISIGTQDNGELYHKNDGWFTNRGGDWYTAMSFDFTPNGYVYYHDGLERRNPVNGGNQDFGLPAVQSSNNLQMAFTHRNYDLAFAGTTQLFRTTNLSDPNPEWELVHDEGFQVKSIQIHPRNPEIVAVIMLNNRIYKTHNALDAEPVFDAIELGTGSGNSSSLAMDINDDKIMYVALGTKVYRTYDDGVNWENITGTLPSVNVKKMFLDSARNDESVYLATAIGVYYRNKEMSDWKAFNQGLPTIANITDFMLYDDVSVGRKLRVSYYGRGVFETSLFTSNGCEPPADFTLEQDGIATKCSWSGSDSVSIQYRNTRSTNWITTSTSGNEYWLKWLEHCQTYEVRVASFCGSERGLYSIPTRFEVEGKQLPEVWEANDVGSNANEGSHCFNPATQEIFITSTGTDVWGTSDQMYFISQPIAGDLDIIARVTQVGNTSGWAKSGLMMRQSRTAQSQHAMLCMTPSNGVALQWRSTAFGNSENANIEGIGMPYWLKLSRSGNDFKGYMSANGDQWSLVESVTIPMTSEIEIGVFACSHNEVISNLTIMDNVSLFPRIVGLESIDIKPVHVSLFPNPSSGNTTIKCDQPVLNVAISDMNGSLIKSIDGNNSFELSFDLTSMDSGTYLIQCILADGRIVTKKLELMR